MLGEVISAHNTRGTQKADKRALPVEVSWS